MADELKAGVETTEYAQAKSGSAWAIVATVLGLVTTIGSAALQHFGTESTAGIIAGAAIAVIGIVSKCFVDLGYIKSRTDVKVAAEENRQE